MSTEITMLELMNYENGRIFDLVKTETGFEITEACDQYFSVDLTADELKQLGQELIALADAAQS